MPKLGEGWGQAGWFFLDQAISGRWFVINNNNRKDWEAWQCSNSEEIPFYAFPVGGHPRTVLFNSPESRI